MRMNQMLLTFSILNLVLTSVFLHMPCAQENRQFTDFRGRHYSSQELGDALFPTEEIPKTRGPRGVEPQFPKPAPSAVALNVLFEFNSDKILPQFYDDLDKLGHVLTRPQYAGYSVQIAGHTDNIGPERYNLHLSDKRAESVKRYLVEHFNIDSQRLMTRGYGEIQPIETNATPEGRRINRRVEVENLGR